MNSTTINPDTGKGYLLQLAIALEFLAPDSRLRAEIFKIIDPAIFPVRYNGLEYFESDDDLKNKLMKLPKNYIFVACDKSKTHKLGDIAFKVSKQDGTTYLVRLEVKNSTTQDYLYKGCVDFIKKTQTCDLGDYFVFLSNYKMERNPNKNKKSQKTISELLGKIKNFFIIDGIKDFPSSLDLAFLSSSRSINLEDFVGKFCRTNSLYAQQMEDIFLKDEKVTELTNEIQKKDEMINQIQEESKRKEDEMINQIQESKRKKDEMINQIQEESKRKEEEQRSEIEKIKKEMELLKQQLKKKT